MSAEPTLLVKNPPRYLAACREVGFILGFLGILVIVAIIFGGVKMMTSAGDADKMGEGRKIVIAGAIGLIIVLAAYAISGFVINSLRKAL